MPVAGTEGCTTRMLAALTTSTIGSKSRTGSYGCLASRPRLMSGGPMPPALSQGCDGQETDAPLPRHRVGLEAVGPAVPAEVLVDLVQTRRQPRQHVAQRAEIAHLRQRTVLRLAEGAVQASRDRRILLVGR